MDKIFEIPKDKKVKVLTDLLQTINANGVWSDKRANGYRIKVVGKASQNNLDLIKKALKKNKNVFSIEISELSMPRFNNRKYKAIVIRSTKPASKLTVN